MSDSSENYYYEIALTNRQVLVSFVVLLGCVLLAFGAGVWVGRMPPGQAFAAEMSGSPAATDEPSSLANLEEFQFPSDQAAGRLRKPDLSQLRSDSAPPPPPSPPPSRDTTLAQDVGSAPTGNAQRPASPPPPAVAPSPPPPQRPAAPPPSAPPPSASATGSVPAGAGFVVQVFATREESQAQKVREQLLRAGYEAFISSVLVGSLNNYRVRVGPYASRDPAERAAREITTDFKLETWVTAAGN